MSDVTALAVSNFTEDKSLSKELSLSQLLPQALRNKPADVLAIVLTGRELGLAPMQAIRGIHIISGKTSLSADLMGALVRRSPECEYLRLVESTDKICTYATKRKGDPEVVMSFTAANADLAGLSGDNWRKYPKAMLRARCLAQICRSEYPGACLGLYDSDSGEIVDSTATPVPGSQAAHVASVAEALKPAVATPQPEITDVEFTESPAVSEPGSLDGFRERIQEAKNLADLNALKPELRALPQEDQLALRAPFKARLAELTAAGV